MNLIFVKILTNYERLSAKENYISFYKSSTLLAMCTVPPRPSSLLQDGIPSMPNDLEDMVLKSSIPSKPDLLEEMWLKSSIPSKTDLLEKMLSKTNHLIERDGINCLDSGESTLYHIYKMKYSAKKLLSL